MLDFGYGFGGSGGEGDHGGDGVVSGMFLPMDSFERFLGCVLDLYRGVAGVVVEDEEEESDDDGWEEPDTSDEEHGGGGTGLSNGRDSQPFPII